MIITEPGIYAISADAYHADPCIEPSLSSSLAKLLVNKTPLHCWHAHPRLNPMYEPEEKEAFDIGKACHSLMLNDPQIFEIIDAPDWRTKVAKDGRDEARAAGKIPLLVDQFERVSDMFTAARMQLDEHREAQAAFTGGRPEATLIFKEGGVWCRARLDWLPDDRRFFDDFKTCDCADPDAFQRIIISLGYDVQAAFYRRGIRALGLSENPNFRFVVQEKDPPYMLSVIGLTPGLLDLADRKVDKALRLWAECLETNKWPGYPNRTMYVDCPSWHEAQYLDREVRDAEAAGTRSAIDWG